MVFDLVTWNLNVMVKNKMSRSKPGWIRFLADNAQSVVEFGAWSTGRILRYSQREKEFLVSDGTILQELLPRRGLLWNGLNLWSIFNYEIYARVGVPHQFDAKQGLHLRRNRSFFTFHFWAKYRMFSMWDNFVVCELRVVSVCGKQAHHIHVRC